VGVKLVNIVFPEHVEGKNRHVVWSPKLPIGKGQRADCYLLI
jgi:hypothetical protein